MIIRYREIHLSSEVYLPEYILQAMQGGEIGNDVLGRPPSLP